MGTQNLCFRGKIEKYLSGLGICIGLDKSGYWVNIFLISSRKHVVGTH